MSQGVPRAERRSIQAVDRRHRILERVAAEQTIHVGELARELRVSEMTIRRDIRRMERDGFLRQTYGGATAHITRSYNLSFNARALQHTREKRLIGIRALELIGDAQVVYLGIGTTAEQVARYLPSRPDLAVVTASLPIAGLLGTRSIRVTVLGGTVLQDELHCIGAIALRTLERFRFDLAIVGAAGLTSRWGITELTDEEAEVQRTAIGRASRVVLIADGSKLGAITSAAVAPVEAADVLVTDPSAPADELAALRRAGLEVVVAGSSPETRRRTGEPAAEAGEASESPTPLEPVRAAR